MDKSTTELRSVTCHMGSHSVTCHPTQVSAPRLNPSHAGQYSIYLPRRDGRLSLPYYSETQPPGVELATSRSRIQRPNHWATKQQSGLVCAVGCTILVHYTCFGTLAGSIHVSFINIIGMRSVDVTRSFIFLKTTTNCLLYVITLVSFYLLVKFRVYCAYLQLLKA